MELKAVLYTSTEINENDKHLLNRYFSIMHPEGLDGKALTLDLLQGDSISELEKISNVDVTLMLKLFESLDFPQKSRYKRIEEIIKHTRSKWIVTSFATKTISGKGMQFKQRRWFDLMLQRMGLSFSKIEKPNETFYIIKNSKNE